MKRRVRLQILMLSSIFAFSCRADMQRYEYKAALLEKAVPTELTAYQLLKKNPLKSDVNYVAVPWSTLINAGKMSELSQLGLTVDGGFTICQHIRYKEILPILKKMGVTVLFTPHAEPSKDPAIKVLPFPHIAINGIAAKPQKDILYSFIGFSNHPVRKALFDLTWPKDAVIKRRAVWHFSKSGSQTQRRQLAEKREYQDVLARSRFSLCLRGTGASTLRFWESLQAGAIPVLLSDDMMLPENFDWSRCVIFIKEADVASIDSIIRGVSTETEAAMRKACYEAYAYFQGKNFVSVIRDYFDGARTGSSRGIRSYPSKLSSSALNCGVLAKPDVALLSEDMATTDKRVIA